MYLFDFGETYLESTGRGWQLITHRHSRIIIFDKSGIDEANRSFLLYTPDGKADEAAKQLEAVPVVAGEDGAAELRADVLAARGDVKGARTKYLEALANADKLGLDRDSIQLKLDNLASPVAAKSNGS